jgi:hypothetical protein
LVRELAETLGQLLLEAMDRKNPTDAVDQGANRFRNALDAFIRGEGVRKGGKGKRSLIISRLIELAEIFFEAERKRPTKSRLREVMAKLELAPKSKNLKSDWRDILINAGLSELPEE